MVSSSHVLAPYKLLQLNGNSFRVGLQRKSYHELTYWNRGLSTFQVVNQNTRQKLQETLKRKYLLINDQYEQMSGIAEIRLIQNKVLEAESKFVDISKRRRSFQDQIDELKLKLDSIKDKIDTTPKSSDGYLNLITTEHKLLREKIVLDLQLTQLKEKEQLAFDNMSKLLRQSHECERLRQDRSKYWNIITLLLSFGCSSIALITQKIRSQNTLKLEMKLLKSELESGLSCLNEELKSQRDEFKLSLNALKSSSDIILETIGDINPKNGSESVEGFTKEKTHMPTSWISYIGGLGSLVSWFYQP